MLSELLSVYRSYKRLRAQAKSEPEALAWKALTEKVSFRLDNVAAFSRLHGFKMIYRTLRSMRSAAPYFKETGSSNPHLVLECNQPNPKIEVEYITHHTGEKPGFSVVKSELSSAFKNHPLAMLAFFWIALPLAIRSFFNPAQRGNKTLHITLIAEQAALLYILKKNKITHLYDFSPFLIDSNWSYLLTKNLQLKYTKIPSPGPLFTHNSELLADCLVLSSGYHLEEINHLPSIKVKTFEYGLPESAFSYIHKYHPHFPATKKKTLGFYSHGTWLRRKLGQAEDGLHIDQAEMTLLADLSRFLKENPSYELILFIHPKERKADHLKDTQAFYHQFFEGLTYRFSEDEGGSVLQFDQVDIGVIALSTILFERLFCGYKTIIGKYNIANFPSANSALEQITFDSYSQLSTLIHKVSDMPENEFFMQRGMAKYRHDYYPYFSKKQPVELTEIRTTAPLQ